MEGRKTENIYHIAPAQAAKGIAAPGGYTPETFGTEGFIHGSYARQVVAVANRLFRGRSGLVLIEIDPGALGCRVVNENLEGGTELFPHIYGPIRASAVVEIHDFPCDSDGAFQIPRTVTP